MPLAAMRLRSPKTQWTILGVLTPLYAATLVVIRGRPTLSTDSGIFLSVAGRLLRGDRLYADVWDNKPPLFYYAEALALYVGGWRGPFLIDVIWLSIAAVAMWLLLAAANASPATRWVGAAVYPLLLTGSWYVAGYSELPPLALAPAVGWLWLRDRPATAGGLLAVIGFLRPDYALVFAAMLVAPSVVGMFERTALPRKTVRLLTGLAAVAAAATVLLVFRGELTPYIRTVRSDLGYPSRALVATRARSGVAGHVAVVWHGLTYDGVQKLIFLPAVLAFGALAAGGLRRVTFRRSRLVSDDPAVLLSVLLVGTTVATAATLAATALWIHNLEMIALPAAFATCLAVARLEAAVRNRSLRFSAIFGAAAVSLVAFGGLSLDSPGPRQPFSDWWHAPRSISAVALDDEAATIRPASTVVTYARLGGNDDDAHAAFIDHRLKLACPWFHQYVFSANLQEVLSCIRSRAPELVLVAPEFRAYHGRATENWNAFVSDGRRLLRARYVHALARQDHDGIVVVWRRR